MSKMKTSSKVIIGILAVIIVIAAIVIIYGVVMGNWGTSIARLETKELEKGDLEEVVFADGQVRADNYTQVYPTSIGIVKEINVSENDKVNADDLLMKLEITNQTGGTLIQEIKAPIAGTVTNIWAKTENQVSPGSTPLVEIVGLDNLNIEGLVSESDVDRVAADQEVRLDFPALDENNNGEEYTGKVIFVAQSPNDLSAANPNYRVAVKFEELSESVKFGMTANMEIIAEEAKNVLYIDNLFLFKKEGDDYVTKLIDPQTGETEDVKMELGFEGENETEITSGAKEGDDVVLPGAEKETELPGMFSN